MLVTVKAIQGEGKTSYLKIILLLQFLLDITEITWLKNM
jgi:hypothetical protein